MAQVPEVPLAVRQGFLIRLELHIREGHLELDPLIKAARERGYEDYAQRMELNVAFELSILEELKAKYGS